jgi:hypothetical protein
MKSITLQRPWPFAITHLGKRIENRSWAPWPALIGTRIAIHAGKTLDASGAEWMQEEGLAPAQWPAEAAVQGAIVCTAVIAGVVRDSDDPWFFGPFGWLLQDVQALAMPVECRGMQGIWNVPPHVVAQMESVGTVPALQLMEVL